MKLTNGAALSALEDVHRNDGMMWAPRTGIEATMLWDELRRRGWVRGNAITPAGREALRSMKGGEG